MQEKITSFTNDRDFWVAYDGVHTGPTFKQNESDGQDRLRKIAYRYIKQWRTCVDA